MQKIPTLFKRDPQDMRRVLPEVTPGCEWVLAGEGTATRKYDGTCCMFDGERWWARREVQPGKASPPKYRPISTDPNTGKTVGWEPIEQTGFAKWHAEAVPYGQKYTGIDFTPGTYELCGPKVQGNPEGFDRHGLIRHGNGEMVDDPGPLGFERTREVVLSLYEQQGIEGLVWHHPDGRMAKLKARDFPGDR